METGSKEGRKGNPPALQAVALFLVLISTLAFAGALGAQTGMVLGPRTWDQWKAQAGWDNYEAGNYSPPEDKVATFKRLVGERDATFMVFGGSWCPDSKTQLPIIFRFFKLASIPVSRVELYGVDHSLREPTHTAERLNISRIPTLVVFSGGKEIGRIAEFPRPTWEDDLIQILSS